MRGESVQVKARVGNVSNYGCRAQTESDPYTTLGVSIRLTTDTLGAELRYHAGGAKTRPDPFRDMMARDRICDASSLAVLDHMVTKQKVGEARWSQSRKISSWSDSRRSR